jgi:queuosine precursor transporter
VGSNAPGIASRDGLRLAEGLVFLLLFCLTIPAANWLIGHVGTECALSGPCVIPVAPGLLAPSGVLMVGAALVLRDLVQRRFGAGIGICAILMGAALSGLLAPPALVIASATAFLISESVDFAVYTPLARKHFVTAVAASGFFGLVIDSVVFLWLAFGSLEFLAGQIAGKAWMIVLSIPLMMWLKKRDERLGLIAP